MDISDQIIEKEMGCEEKDRHGSPQIKAEGNDPAQGNRFLQGRPPVVIFFILASVLPEIKREFDGMIDEIDAVTEPVGECNIPSFETERLDPHRRQQQMWKDGHAAFAEDGFSL